MNLTYTPPKDIEGEPEQVRELSLQQLVAALGQVIELSAETATQLLAAGLDRHATKDEWLASPEGQDMAELISVLGAATAIGNRLQQAE